MSEDCPDYEPWGEESPTCSVCGCALEWIDCGACEDGYVDLYEEDPIMFYPGAVTRCPECKGRGGRLECTNAEEHARLREEKS